MPSDGVVGLLLFTFVLVTCAKSSTYSCSEAGLSLCLLLVSCYKFEVSIHDVEAPYLFLFEFSPHSEESA